VNTNGWDSYRGCRQRKGGEGGPESRLEETGARQIKEKQEHEEHAGKL
jgi:hypothetical protein